MRMNIIFVAGMTLAGATLMATPSHAQAAGGTLGIPNATAPTDSVRQGKAGINAAQAEATRTTGNAEYDARATIENAEAGVGNPTLGASANATAAATMNTRTAANSRNSRSANRNEQEITRQLNREQSAHSSTTASGSAATR